MDDIDRALLAALRRDAPGVAGPSWAALVGLSGPSVTDRVPRLEAAGVITGYHAAVDPGGARPVGRRARRACTCPTPPTRTP